MQRKCAFPARPKYAYTQADHKARRLYIFVFVGSENNLTSFIKRPQRPESGPQPLKCNSKQCKKLHRKRRSEGTEGKGFLFPVSFSGDFKSL